MKLFNKSVLLAAFLPFIMSCNSSEKENATINSAAILEFKESSSRNLPAEFKNYWYDGKAEITSYKLTQERYGELRDGTAVNIYVTEDFLPNVQVKADTYSEENIPVMKLNRTKKYLTGIYPYSVMTSTFSPVDSQEHALKVVHSMQEWCGQVYTQLNNRKNYEIMSHSYFEGEADQELALEKIWLEDELWNLIRLNPKELPTGEFTILPGFEYFRMSHRHMEPYTANGNLVKGDSITTYTLRYSGVSRELKIYFNSSFPYNVERWEETHANGLKTTAEKLKTLQAPYWRLNKNSNIFLRDSLGL